MSPNALGVDLSLVTMREACSDSRHNRVRLVLKKPYAPQVLAFADTYGVSGADKLASFVDSDWLGGTSISVDRCDVFDDYRHGDEKAG